MKRNHVVLIKRLLAYSSISHVGYILLGLVAGTKLTSGATNFMRLHTVGESDGAHPTRRKKK